MHACVCVCNRSFKYLRDCLCEQSFCVSELRTSEIVSELLTPKSRSPGESFVFLAARLEDPRGISFLLLGHRAPRFSETPRVCPLFPPWTPGTSPHPLSGLHWSLRLHSTSAPPENQSKPLKTSISFLYCKGEQSSVTAGNTKVSL